MIEPLLPPDIRGKKRVDDRRVLIGIFWQLRTSAPWADILTIQEKHGLSERHACHIVGQHRGTQRYMPTLPADEDALTCAIVALASEYGRYGYRRVTALLQAEG